MSRCIKHSRVQKSAACRSKDCALPVLERCVLGLFRIYVTTDPTATVIKGKPCVVHFKRNCWKTTDASAVWRMSPSAVISIWSATANAGRKKELRLVCLTCVEGNTSHCLTYCGLNITENCRLTAGTQKLCDIAPRTFTSALWGETLVFLCYHADGENKHTVGTNHINLSYEVINRHLGAPPLSFGLEVWCELPGGFDNVHDT